MIRDLVDRQQSDLDQMTLAIANGFAISMSKEAAASWRASHVAPVAAGEVDEEAGARQRAALGRLAGLFPGAVKAKAN